ncbi:hypothetical protein [Algoriphagus marinus]|jgi:hypothetical protein|uniref:hypothetical protein n=1 Tax=Algoriphagus marinus TaxID=1925762 RepID=UPI000AFDFD34|nr:hypothetical protein [Algoriphagus marinus]
MKKLRLIFVLTLILFFNLKFNFEQSSFHTSYQTQAQENEFIWGYQLMWEPCSQWWDIDHKICRESGGGYCQASAQTLCPGPPYFT